MSGPPGIFFTLSWRYSCAVLSTDTCTSRFSPTRSITRGSFHAESHVTMCCDNWRRQRRQVSMNTSSRRDVAVTADCLRLLRHTGHYTTACSACKLHHGHHVGAVARLDQLPDGFRSQFCVTSLPLSRVTSVNGFKSLSTRGLNAPAVTRYRARAMDVATKEKL